MTGTFEPRRPEESGQRPEEKSEASKPVEQGTGDQSSLPLYLRNKSDGARDNAQDEKDESSE
jgi:hypothetical protein